MRMDVNIDGLYELMNALNPKPFEKAMNRTVRRMGKRFRKVATKEVRETYNIKAKKLKQYMKTVTVTTKKRGTEWRFYVSGKPLSLIHFGARQTKKGVSVKVRKDRGRRVIKGAFVAPGKGGNLRVFKRTSKERLPIESKHTLSVPQMFNKEILDKAKREVEANYEKEFKHNLDYYLGRLK